MINQVRAVGLGHGLLLGQYLAHFPSEIEKVFLNSLFYNFFRTMPLKFVLIIVFEITSEIEIIYNSEIEIIYNSEIE